jgi:hypothetical protein
MEIDQLDKLKYCPYCFKDCGLIEQEFEVAKQEWKYFDAETRSFHSNHSRENEWVVFCVKCENEILFKDICEVKKNE